MRNLLVQSYSYPHAARASDAAESAKWKKIAELRKAKRGMQLSLTANCSYRGNIAVVAAWNQLESVWTRGAEIILLVMHMQHATIIMHHVR